MLRYLVEEVLGRTPEEALKTLTLQEVKDNHLGCIVNLVDERPDEFDKDDVRHLVYFAYPELPFPTQEELAIETYKAVLEGKRRTFPKNYFTKYGTVGEERAVICFRYLCEEILKLKTKEEIEKTFLEGDGLAILSKYKLRIIMTMVFFSMADLLGCAYPDLFEDFGY